MYKSTVYVAMVKIEGLAEPVGVFKTRTEAGLEARAALSAHLNSKGFDYKQAETWLGDGSSPDGEYGHWVHETTLYL